VQDVKSPESWSTEAEKAMNSVQKIFEVDYVTRGTLKNVVIAANDFEQAAKAASVKLAMIRTTTEFDILAIRRRTSVLTSNQEMNLDQVDAVSALSELARIMHKYPTFEDGEQRVQAYSMSLEELINIETGRVGNDALRPLEAFVVPTRMIFS
jgi:hypothetical protein